MSVRVPIFLDAETWRHLKNLAGPDLRSLHNTMRLLIWREWAARSCQLDETVSKQPRPEVAPSIPSSFHIHQGG